MENQTDQSLDLTEENKSNEPGITPNRKQLFSYSLLKKKKAILIIAVATACILGASLFLIAKTAYRNHANNIDKKTTQEENDQNFNRNTVETSSDEETNSDDGSVSKSPEPPTQTPSPTPTPIPMGTVKGETRVGYYSRPLAGVNVTATGEKTSKTTKTKEDGSFYIDQLPVDYYTISIDHQDYRFGNFKLQVQPGNNSTSGIALGLLKNPQPLNMSIAAFSDNNSNGSKEGGENGLGAVITINKKSGGNWQTYKSFSADQQGNYSLSVIESGEYNIEPGNYTFYTKPTSQTFVVDGYGGNKFFSFAYVPTSSNNGFTMYVFNDKNENSTRDADEEYIHYQYAKVTRSSTGSSSNFAISETGTEYTHIDYGTYNIDLIPETQSWSYYYKITKGSTSVNVTSTSEQQKVELGAHKLF